MTVSEQMNYLAVKLDDPSMDKWKGPELLVALNNAQTKLANLIHPGYLTELQVEELNVDVTTGKLDLSTGLLNKVFRGKEGVVFVKVTNGLVATETEITKTKVFENALYTPSLKDPAYYVFGNNIYIVPSAIAKIDVCYLRAPKKLLYEFTYAAASPASTSEFSGDASQGLSSSDDAYNGTTDKERVVIYDKGKDAYFVVTDYDATGNGKGERLFTVSPVADANFGTGIFYFLTHSFDALSLAYLTSELNESLHELMVLLAEGICWGTEEETVARGKAAFESAYDEIKLLNVRYTEAPGIGAKGKRSGRQGG